MKGTFAFVDTHGIPLDLVLDTLQAKGMMPDWLEFYDSAIAAGWKQEGIVSKLITAVGDVYGREFSEEWERRFRFVLATRA